MASGSQDATIRLWNIEPWQKESSLLRDRSTDRLSDELLDAFEASLGELGEAEEGGRQISLKRHILTVKDDQARYPSSFFMPRNEEIPFLEVSTIFDNVRCTSDWT